jgi:hypothetical protein
LISKRSHLRGVEAYQKWESLGARGGEFLTRKGDSVSGRRIV